MARKTTTNAKPYAKRTAGKKREQRCNEAARHERSAFHRQRRRGRDRRKPRRPCGRAGSSIASPPGSTLSMKHGELSVQVKVRGCKRLTEDQLPLPHRGPPRQLQRSARERCSEAGTTNPHATLGALARREHHAEASSHEPCKRSALSDCDWKRTWRSKSPRPHQAEPYLPTLSRGSKRTTAAARRPRLAWSKMASTPCTLPGLDQAAATVTPKSRSTLSASATRCMGASDSSSHSALADAGALPASHASRLRCVR